MAYLGVAARIASFAISGIFIAAAPVAPRSPTVPAPRATTEDCVVVDPAIVAAENTGNDWKIMQGATSLLDFGANGAGAARAIEVIQHYHFTRQCFVRRPNAYMMYWKNGIAIPPGNMPGQDCVSLNPGAVQADFVAGGWKIINGSVWLLDYGSDRAAADRALTIIRTYGLNRECFIARPHVTMQYWLAE